MRSKILKIILLVSILILLGVVYNYVVKPKLSNKSSSSLVSSKDKNTSTATASATNSTITKETEFLSTLLNISRINIDTSIFDSKSFESLKDNHIPIVNTEPVGRTNPFAPFDMGQISLNSSDPVSTLPASEITANSALLLGSVSLELKPKAIYFEWGTSESLGQSTEVVDQSLVGNFTKSLTGLKSKTKYYFRAVVQVGTNYIVGDVMSFTTN